MKSFGSLFSGGRLVDYGVKGLVQERFAVEYDRQINELTNVNFEVPAITSKVEDVDYAQFEGVDIIWASPECKEFGRKIGKKEGETQISQALSVCRAIVEAKPETFLLENVTGYKESTSLDLILRTLNDEGFIVDIQNYNMEYYGVPQSRKRMILRANKQGNFRELKKNYKIPNWYDTIYDLFDQQEDSEFYLSHDLVLSDDVSLFKAPFIVGIRKSRVTEDGLPYPTVRRRNQPVFTLTCSSASAAKIWTGTRVIDISSRMIARLMTVNDDYILNGKKTITSKILGNGVPSYFARQVVESVL